MNKDRLKIRLLHYYKKWVDFSNKSKVKNFLKNGMKPWQKGYIEYRYQALIKTLNNKEILQLFEQSKQLPKKYGFRLDERIIEYPWVLSRLPRNSCRILDAGSSFNFDYIITNPIISNKDLFIITLSPESQCFWKEKVSYIYGDLRNNPLKDCYFDIVICISTLEHIGMENALYTGDKIINEYKQKTFFDVVKEFNRILKPNGNLYITVPYGKRKNYGFFQSFDADLIQQTIKTFQGTLNEIDYYQYLENGWVISEKSKCSACEYFDIHQTKYFNKKSYKDYDSDYAAAARAIACMKFTKKHSKEEIR